MKILTLIITLIICLSCKENKTFTIIAHRGASGYLPEHTLESAALAHGFGVDFIEPDLVMTKDNKLIVLHDIHLDTTTNVSEVFPNRKRDDGRYYAIDFTLDEIKKLKVHEREKLNQSKRYFSNRFPKRVSSFEVPSFLEFVELVEGLNFSRNMSVGIYPEIKAPEFHLKEGKDITREVINFLRAQGYEKGGKIFIQCFYPPSLKRLKNEFQTTIPLIQLIADDSWKESSVSYSKMLTDEGLKEVSTYAAGIGPWLPQILNENGQSTGIVKLAKKYKLKVHAYTHRVEQIPSIFKSEEELFVKLFNHLNIDGIFSDFSDRVIKWRNSL